MAWEKESSLPIILWVPIIVYGAYFGYRNGENTDKKNTIEKIQQEREQEKEKDER